MSYTGSLKSEDLMAKIVLFFSYNSGVPGYLSFQPQFGYSDLYERETRLGLGDISILPMSLALVLHLSSSSYYFPKAFALCKNKHAVALSNIKLNDL